ncbi:MAG: ATP-binding protein [Myxococcota bacterium]|jgi:ATP-dependent DNA helicase RecG|nr:ATP-binding protein [Myxococcota bacterium]
MNPTLEQLESWLLADESEHLEFKEAKHDFDQSKLVKYCAALANERGGRLVLGVTDKKPRQVVGSSAFQDLGQTKQQLVDRLHLRVEADALLHPRGRVVVFTVPTRPIGCPIQVDGAYFMRAGESLTGMTPDLLQSIFAEAEPDFSATICPQASFASLDPNAIERFREKWVRRSQRGELLELSPAQLLSDAELLLDEGVTYAALVLLGTHKALGRTLGQAELIFEWRSDEASIAYQARREYREGFLLYDDDLWNTINLRNDLYSHQEGLFRHEIPAFNEGAVREAVLNAVSHRDYRLQGSTFVKQWPTRIEVISPGGFPEGITADNILERQSPRNRRLADALARCGLVERSGQGADRMFSAAVREGKLPPDYSASDPYQVSVVLDGQVQDPKFLAFLERLCNETQRNLSLDDLVVLDAVRRERPLPERVRGRVPALLEIGAIERLSKKQLTLSRRFYSFVGKRGEYTRRRGLDRNASKALLLQHIEQNAQDGCPLSELIQVIPGMKPTAIQNLLRELKRSGRAHHRGRTKAARWFPGEAQEEP